ncbi:hypothetical protein [Desulfobacter vibrioformis]|uniref:hypothetical protein n=1 Tax=Desulfobacter vibrioformis TaxID=34031 RepID=UPI00054E55D8|nr:hypothetical protein [Desulfobacter vibrioformis]
MRLVTMALTMIVKPITMTGAIIYAPKLPDAANQYKCRTTVSQFPYLSAILQDRIISQLARHFPYILKIFNIKAASAARCRRLPEYAI